MTKDGKIEWVRYDEKDEATRPDTGKELIIIALKGGKPVFIPVDISAWALSSSTG